MPSASIFGFIHVKGASMFPDAVISLVKKNQQSRINKEHQLTLKKLTES